MAQDLPIGTRIKLKDGKMSLQASGISDPPGTAATVVQDDAGDRTLRYRAATQSFPDGWWLRSDQIEPLVPSEPAAMAAALAAIAELPFAAQQRVLRWLDQRTEEDRREANVKAAGGAFQAESWCVGALEDSMVISRAADDAVREHDTQGEVVAVNGWAVVERRYGVHFQIGDADGNVDGDDVEMFATRAEAEAFAAGLKVPEMPDEAPAPDAPAPETPA
jgi:hypothetical protein